MANRVSAISPRLAAAASVALVAFAALADNEATCPDQAGVECFSTTTGHANAPPSAPAQDCAGGPCRTPVRVAPAHLALQVLGGVSTFIADPVRPLISAEPAAPPTPPPVDLR